MTNKEEKINDNNRLPFLRSTIFLGMLFLITGALLFTINFGILPAELRIALLSWQAALIAIGLYTMCYRRFIAGTVCVGIGIFFILPKCALAFPNVLAFASFNFTARYFPLLLIFAGVMIIVSYFVKRDHIHRRHNRFRNHAHQYFNENNYREICRESGKFYRHLAFAGGEYILMDTVFKGGEITVYCGGITLDLRKTTLPEGITTLRIRNVFGGIKIIVPETWFVRLQTNAIFGGFQDKRLFKNDMDESHCLVIEGESIFGGVEMTD